MGLEALAKRDGDEEVEVAVDGRGRVAGGAEGGAGRPTSWGVGVAADILQRQINMESVGGSVGWEMPHGLSSLALEKEHSRKSQGPAACYGMKATRSDGSANLLRVLLEETKHLLQEFKKKGSDYKNGPDRIVIKATQRALYTCTCGSRPSLAPSEARGKRGRTHRPAWYLREMSIYPVCKWGVKGGN